MRPVHAERRLSMSRRTGGFLWMVRVSLGVATFSFLLSPTRLVAWDTETHISILKTAMVVSPTVAAILTASFTGRAMDLVGPADPMDPDCHQHPGERGSRDSAAHAEKIFQQITAPKGFPVTPYFRAQLLGQLAHYAS